ncbi:MAG TPA: YetF domain-containing protein [Sphingomonadaceae bacterium]|nr:YetF domain-containing protein [Sphingomonadaceae bacterium]
MDIVLRATVMFAILYLLLRLLGKRELAQLTPFELVMLIVMGDLVQQGVTHNDFSITGATLAIATFGFWSALLAWFSFRSRRAEKLLDGEPAVLVRSGEVLTGNLNRHRITLSELEAEMRLAGIAHLPDVAWAILETEGKVSFIRKDDAAPHSPENGPAT